jgi:hypothetical protein
MTLPRERKRQIQASLGVTLAKLPLSAHDTSGMLAGKGLERLSRTRRPCGTRREALIYTPPRSPSHATDCARRIEERNEIRRPARRPRGARVAISCMDGAKRIEIRSLDPTASIAVCLVTATERIQSRTVQSKRFSVLVFPSFPTSPHDDHPPAPQLPAHPRGRPRCVAKGLFSPCAPSGK